MTKLTSRKKRPLDRKSTHIRDSKLIVIATEGSITERIYFESFRLNNIKVRVIPSEDGQSSPEHVLDNALKYKIQFDLGIGDELWLVIDVDRWPLKTLSQVAAKSRAAKIGLAVSNPSFEVWLALHFDAYLPDTVNNPTLIEHLRSQLGSYNKHRYEVSTIIKGLDTAIKRARELDLSPKDRWPLSVGSRCYKIAQSFGTGRRKGPTVA
ncbi:RloB family protein [Allorhizobium ampelinum]|uniref:RloB family protein n=1 Tax=Allorhizobium ampelinum TaxID=3025782 RepID=UPI001F35006A|nr:RloB family protein [Allorhizobium ampelinum]